jgi:tetratricopeptide (TPR) repeat protein
MHRNWPKFPPLILLICFVFSLVSSVQAQKSPGKSQAVAPVIFLDSSKEQDGLVGPVRRVQTEISKLDTRSGVVTEGPRHLLEVTTYNLKGERVDNVSYPIPGPAGTEEYKYDDKGNIVEMTLRGADGSIISREVYSYEVDGVGNWTKMTTSIVLFEDGALRHEPVEATYRTIAYFYDETIAKLLDNSSAAKNPSISASPVSLAAKSAEPTNPPANPVRPLPSPNAVVDPSKRKADEEKKSVPPEAGKVQPRESPSSSAKPTETAVGARAENSVKPTVSSTVKEAAPATNTRKAAFEFYKTGREQFNMGNLQAAIESYQHAIDLEPEYADVYLSLGHAYLRQKKSKEAIKAFKDATRINPELDEAHYGLGLEYFRAGEMKDAAQAFKKAVKANPRMAKAHYGLALAYQELGKQDLLLEEYRILQTLDAELAKKLSDSFPESNLPCNGRRCD